MGGGNTTDRVGPGQGDLSRRLGLASTTLSGLGVILGAGVYVLLGLAAREAGSALWLSFLIAAATAGLTGLSYAQLSRLRPRNAPEFQYLTMAFGRRLGFLGGWLVLWAGIVSTAVVALGFAGYLEDLLGTPVVPVALGLVASSSVVVFMGIGGSVLLLGALTVPAAAGLLLIIAMGLPYVSQADLLDTPAGAAGVMSAASLVFFAYLGFESMANLSEEMKHPQRDLPRAMLLALVISTVLYTLTALSAVSVLGWQGLSASSAPLAAVASRGLGSGAYLFVTLMSLAATASTVLFLLIAMSRAAWAMSCAGALPLAFCVIGRKRRTPWITILLVAFFAGLAISLGSLETVARFTNFAVLLAFTGVNASAIRIIGCDRSGSRPRRLLLGGLVPVLGAASAIWLAISTGWQAAALGGLLLAAGVAVDRVSDRFLQRSRQA